MSWSGSGDDQAMAARQFDQFVETNALPDQRACFGRQRGDKPDDVHALP